MIALVQHLWLSEGLIWSCEYHNVMTKLVDCIIKKAINLFKIIWYSGHKRKVRANFQKAPTELKTERNESFGFGCIVRCELSCIVDEVYAAIARLLWLTPLMRQFVVIALTSPDQWDEVPTEDLQIVRARYSLHCFHLGKMKRLDARKGLRHNRLKVWMCPTNWKGLNCWEKARF